MRPLIAALALFAAASHAAPAPKGKAAEATYFPTTEGAARVYEVRAGDKVEGRYTDVVTKVEKTDSRLQVTVRRDTPGSNSYDLLFVVSAEGLFGIAVSGPDDKPFPYLKSPARVGARWEMDGGTRFEVTREEDTQVPAGKFRTVRVVQVDRNRTTTMWYAPGVGAVKMELDGGRTIVLIEFKPRK